MGHHYTFTYSNNIGNSKRSNREWLGILNWQQVTGLVRSTSKRKCNRNTQTQQSCGSFIYIISLLCDTDEQQTIVAEGININDVLWNICLHLSTNLSRVWFLDNLSWIWEWIRVLVFFNQTWSKSKVLWLLEGKFCFVYLLRLFFVHKFFFVCDRDNFGDLEIFTCIELNVFSVMIFCIGNNVNNLISF